MQELKRATELHILLLLTALFLGLSSCSNYKYGEVETIYTTNKSIDIVMLRAKEWLNSRNSKIKSSSSNELAAKIAIDAERIAYICDLNISIDGNMLKMKTGVEDIIIPNDLIMTDEDGVKEEAKNEIKKEIHDPLIHFINEN